MAVDLIASGKIKAGFERLEAHGCIKEVTAADKVEAIAESYMATKPEERVKTLVLAGTNVERLEITQAIRALLKSEGSVIHPKIAARNFQSLQQDPVEQENSAWGHLMYSDKLERINTGRLSAGMLKRYDHIDAGGWWCSAGVDCRSFKDLQPGQKPKQQIWGCYKPNAPKENPEKPGKVIKYEHPPKADLSLFLLDVPDDLAQRI